MGVAGFLEQGCAWKPWEIVFQVHQVLGRIQSFAFVELRSHFFSECQSGIIFIF